MEVWDQKVQDHIGDGEIQVAALAATRKRTTRSEASAMGLKGY